MFHWSEAEPGAKVVLNFWPISRLAVLIKVLLIKKACTRITPIGRGGGS